MKISRIKHVIITSIIFLVIIAIIVSVYNSMLQAMRRNTQEMVYRVVAREDIAPGETITDKNVERVQVQNILRADSLIYRLREQDTNAEQVDSKEGQGVPTDLWAIGKVATEKIYKGEMLLNKKLSLRENMTGDDTRLYAIPFDSQNTNGYNVELGDVLDICVVYSDDDRTIDEYQKLPANKVIDIVLAGKTVADIRDESGNSRKYQGLEVVPGYLCFNLTYEEINKVEVAKRQGTLFVGNPEKYYKEGSQAETFMVNASMPQF